MMNRPTQQEEWKNTWKSRRAGTNRMKQSSIMMTISIMVWMLHIASVAPFRDIRRTATASAGYSTSLSTTLVLRGGDASESETAATARADYIKSILSRRLDHVHSGKRAQDFRKWVQSQGGEATIFSMHGVESENDSNNHQKVDFTHVASHLGKIQRGDPFPVDRLNLDIVTTDQSPASQFPGEPQHLIDATSPNLLQLALRAVNLGVHFAPAWSTVGLAFFVPSFRRRYWYKWLSHCIASSGAAWIKWGQWSATRNDMFPEALCDQLATLHSDAPAHNWQFSQLQMESSLGLAKDTLNQVFDSFEETPLASGSIAQVHRAVLCNQLVAVKIRHPRVAQLIDMDFRIMSLGATCLDLVPGLEWLRLRESVDQFSSTMAAQAHLHVEGHHLEVLNYNFGAWPHVSFPRPFYASSAVIIETFEPGQIVTDFLDEYDELAETMNNQQNSAEYQVEEEGDTAVSTTPGVPLKGNDLVPLPVAKFLVTTGLGLYLKMLLVDNLMHADLHPGNILLDLHRSTIQRGSSSNEKALAVVDGKHDKQGSSRLGITLVDAGMVAQLTETEGSVFIGLLASLGSGNGREAAAFALQFSEENLNSVTEKTREDFTNDMIQLFSECCRGYGTKVDVGEVLRGVLGLIRKHQIRIDANFATLVVNVLCVESLAARMFPTYNVLDAARPLLESYRGMCYTTTGTPKQNVSKSPFVKFWLSVMYVKKSFQDRSFFRRERRRQRRSQSAQHVY